MFREITAKPESGISKLPNRAMQMLKLIWGKYMNTPRVFREIIAKLESGSSKLPNRAMQMLKMESAPSIIMEKVVRKI